MRLTVASCLFPLSSSGVFRGSLQQQLLGLVKTERKMISSGILRLIGNAFYQRLAKKTEMISELESQVRSCCARLELHMVSTFLLQLCVCVERSKRLALCQRLVLLPSVNENGTEDDARLSWKANGCLPVPMRSQSHGPIRSHYSCEAVRNLTLTTCNTHLLGDKTVY